MKIQRVALVVHEGKPLAVELRGSLRDWLGQRNIEVSDEGADLVVSLGGDGTMLRAAQLAHADDIPLLGVNIGTTGYLTEVDVGEERAALERALDDRFDLEERMMLSCRAETTGGTREYVSLNEVLVERVGRHRLVRLHVSVGDETLANYNADGVIVATPTGSTAYALSAGGPVVSPKAQCLVVVPVSPHTVFSRPVVLAPDETVTIAVHSESEQAVVSLDGWQGDSLEAAGSVVVSRHPRPLRLVRLAGPGFLARLRSKIPL